MKGLSSSTIRRRVALAVSPNPPNMSELNRLIAELLEEGQREVAYDLVADLVAAATEAGQTAIADELIGSVRQSGAPRSDAEVAWLANYHGLVLLHQHKNDQAVRVLSAGLRFARIARATSLLVSLYTNLGVAAHRRRDPATARRHYRRALALARSDGDRQSAAKLIINLASSFVETGSLDKARVLAQELEGLLTDLGSKSLRATAFHLLGRLAVEDGDLDRARANFHKAAQVSLATGRLYGYAASKQSEGTALLELGRNKAALRCLETALAAATQLQDDELRSLVLSSLGLTLFHLARYDDARDAVEELRALADSLGDRNLWARATVDLAAVLARRGDRRDAANALIQASKAGAGMPRAWRRVVAQNIVFVGLPEQPPDQFENHVLLACALLDRSDHEGRADVLWAAGDICRSLGAAPEVSVAMMQASLVERRRTRDSLAYGRDVAQLGAFARDHGLLRVALSSFSSACRVYERRGERWLAFHVRNDHALVLVRLGRLSDAARELSGCLETAHDLDDRVMELQALGNLTEIDRRRGRLRDAEATGRKALELAADLDDHHETARVLGLLGLVASDTGDLRRATELYTQQLEAARRLGDKESRASALGGLAGIAFRAEKFRRAGQLYGRAAAANQSVSESSEHLAEDLAGALESYARAGDAPKTEQYAQRLVDIAQEWHHERLASGSLAQGARAWLERGDDEIAADLYVASIGVPATEPQVRDTPNELGGLMHAIMIMVFQVEELRGPRAPLFYRRLKRHLNRQVKGAGRKIAPLIEAARDAQKSIPEGPPANYA